jgi:hypothetical protein
MWKPPNFCTQFELSVIFERDLKIELVFVMRRSTLEEQGIQRARATYIVQSFETNRVSLRTSLGNISIAFPRVVDIDWRLDYYIKSNTVERVDVPVYLVNLTVQVCFYCIQCNLFVFSGAVVHFGGSEFAGCR